ncbi:MAG TPA: glycine betaine ABC transporter substrate-binding protein [Candidatus Baltobacteraceae bacterium]|jgi:osmoprotectant transport system substrate-binding protein
MTFTRRTAIASLGATLLLPACAGRGGGANAVAVGSKNFTEALVIGEIYAQSLEAHGFTVRRRLNLGSVQICMAALQHGDIDLYPEYTGTGLIDVLHHAPMQDPAAIYRTVKSEYKKRFNATWLDPSPMNDSQGIVATQAVARRYGLKTLSQLATAAPQLRLAAIAEFLGRQDGLPGLQRVYGGFHFKDVKTYDAGLKYDALLHGDADVAQAFTTDGQIGANNLVLLEDDKHLWPPYNVAPVVRLDALKAHPQIATVLNGIAPMITDVAARSMNYAVDHGKQDPATVAAQFLKEHALH